MAGMGSLRQTEPKALISKDEDFLRPIVPIAVGGGRVAMRLGAIGSSWLLSVVHGTDDGRSDLGQSHQMESSLMR